MPAKGKGVSRDEKKKRALEFLYEKKEPFTLKELESQLPKQKGIVSQSVKEIIQELCDEGMIDSDKIGSGNFYWALPSKASQLRKNKIESSTKLLAELKEKRAALEEKKAKSAEGRQPSAARDAKLAKIQELKAQKAQIAVDMQKYSATDPERIKELKKQTKQCSEAAGRWNDNVAQFFKYFKSRNTEMTAKQFADHFDLPMDWDES